MLKGCPYCSKALPFFSVVRQRLRMDEDKALSCPSCGSVVSSTGDVGLFAALGIGSGFGYLLGKVLYMFLGSNWLAWSIALGAGLAATLLLAYFTAPIRRS